MKNQTRLAAVLLCTFLAVVSHADTGSLQLSLRDFITGYAVVGTVTFNGPQQLTVPTDENGNLFVELQTGQYIIQASAQGYAPLTSQTPVTPGSNPAITIMLDSTGLPEDEQTQRLAQELRPGFTLFHGYVVDPRAGKPIAGVRVQLLNAAVETETNPNGHYDLSVVTPKEVPPGLMGTDTLIFQKSGYDKVVIQNFGICCEDMQLPPLGLQRGNSVIRRDGSHKLSGKSLYEPQSPTPTSKLPESIYKQLAAPGKRFSPAGPDEPAGLPSINVPNSIRVGVGQGGAYSLTYVPCTRHRGSS